MTQQFKYDVFISHSTKDKPAVRDLEGRARIRIDNESRELILVGHSFSVASEAGQIFRPEPNSEWGIDGEIEFKNDKGEASGRRVYLQLKSCNSYYLEMSKDGREVFQLKKYRYTEYWQNQVHPVMLVSRTSDGTIRWMNVTEYLRKQGEQGNKGEQFNQVEQSKQIVFDGEPFTAQSVWRMRDRLFLWQCYTRIRRV